MKKGSVVASLDATLLLRKRFTKGFPHWVAQCDTETAGGRTAETVDRSGYARHDAAVDERLTRYPLLAALRGRRSGCFGGTHGSLIRRRRD
jgi:hypothetical protein